MVFLEKAMACAPSVSAPLVAAVTEATTASRFFLEWVLASPKAAIDFSTPSLNALLPAVVNCSTVVFRVSAPVAMEVSPRGFARGMGFRICKFGGDAHWGTLCASDAVILMLQCKSQRIFVQCTMMSQTRDQAVFSSLRPFDSRLVYLGATKMNSC